MLRFRMKLIMKIFLCYMMTVCLVRADPLLQEEKEHIYYDAVPQIPMKYPYIEPKCCNYSTTDGCSRMGNEGFKGHCMPRNETCLGREFFGTKYCIISKHQSCKCCVPTDCERQTLLPCSTLKGTCMGINDHCNGTSVVSESFCRKDTKKDTCKCCIPLFEQEPEDCPCGQDHNGGCVGSYPSGKKTRGRCMESCEMGHTELAGHTCNKTGGEHCKCCDLRNSCGPTCESPNLLSCVCTINGKSCPDGYCAYSIKDKCPGGDCADPMKDMCPVGSCSCCKEIKDKPSECRYPSDQCIAPNDYCVDKQEADCPKGYAKVRDACNKAKGHPSKERKRSDNAASAKIGIDACKNDNGRKATQIDNINKKCDCCKSLACSSIGNRCTGRGSYCIDYYSNCPPGYTESLDCSKPVIVKETILSMAKCKCCKPRPAECPHKDCFRVGSQCFWKMTHNTSHWENAEATCLKYGQNLAEPQDPQALSQYLSDNYADESYWIGAHGTDNDNAAWVSTGGVIGPNAPWFGCWYNSCDDPHWCMYLKANSGCYTSNQCFGCWVCNGNHVASPTYRTTLCSCDKAIIRP